MTKINISTMVLIIGVITYLPSAVRPQACSCGGAPLLSSLEVPSTPAGVWHFGLTYEFSSITNVYSGSDKLDDDVRSRRVQSGLFEINYGLTERFSIAGLFTLLEQERKTTSNFVTSEIVRTRGIGDGLFLLKYAVLPQSIRNRRQLSIGGGVKVPVGQSDIKRNNILLAADMQPGTGAWDFVLWGHAQQGLFTKFPITVYSTFSYRLNGTNDRFGQSSLGYKFGNELVTSLAVNFNHMTGINYNLGLRYRSTTADAFDNNDVNNSGGKWLNFVPGLNLNVYEKFGVRGEGELPLYRKLNGTQLTTSYTVSFSLFYTIAPPEKDIKFPF